MSKVRKPRVSGKGVSSLTVSRATSLPTSTSLARLQRAIAAFAALDGGTRDGALYYLETLDVWPDARPIFIELLRAHASVARRYVVQVHDPSAIVARVGKVSVIR